jgi:predicted ATPase
MEGPPLRSWELEGFRSIRDRTVVDLGQMNVLVGANSAGKSSLIQSILLAAQTLGTAWTPRPLVLNGPLVQLGLPDDCVNENAKQFSFGFEYCTPDDSDMISAPRDQKGSVEAKATFQVKGSNLDLDYCQVSTVSEAGDDEQGIKQSLTFSRATQKVQRERFRAFGLKGELLNAYLQSDIDPVTVSDSTLPDVSAARFRQFLPYQLFERENANEAALASLIQAAEQAAEERIRGEVASRRFTLRAGPRLRFRREVPRPVVKFLRDYLRDQDIGLSVPKGSTLTVAELLESLSPEALDAVRRMEGSDWFAGHHGELASDINLTAASADEPFDSLVLSARRFFIGYVRHLGPIRIEPKPLYGLSEAASGDSVGSSGEYTAALLDSYGGRPIDCPMFGGDEVQRLPLSDGVNYWLQALGLLSSVDVQERGKLGYEVNLRIEGVGKTLDLTAVGVGVSQALPVIVQGLVAPPGSLVMFEQPELHLHPDVQGSIADFCLALAKSGRQVILETHSEYLVNRIRRRAVEDLASEIPRLVRMHFVEREGGATQIRPVELTSHGGLKDWPAGFMDQSAYEAEAIIEALERRAASDDQSAR